MNLQQKKSSVVTLVRDHRVDALIGPGCSPAARGAGRLASVWNVPVVAYGGTDTVLSDKSTFTSFSRTVGLTSVVSHVISQLPVVFGWKSLCVYHTPVSGHFRYAINALKETTFDKNFTYVDPFFTFKYISIPNKTDEQIKEHGRVLEGMKSKCRGKMFKS